VRGREDKPRASFVLLELVLLLKRRVRCAVGVWTRGLVRVERTLLIELIEL